MLPISYFAKMKNVILIESDSRVVAYDGSKLKLIGKITLIAVCRNDISMQEFLIINTNSSPQY